MSKIIIFGETEIDLEGIDDPSVKVILLSPEYDYQDDNTISITDKNILDYYKEENLEDSNEYITFVDCTGASKHYLDVMYRLQTARFHKRTYLVGPTSNEKKMLIVRDLPQVSHFNLFDGDEIPSTMNETDKKAVFSFFKNCSTILHSYLHCGFDKKEMNDIPAGWTMNVSNIELYLLIHYYGLHPIGPDMSHQIEFCQNSQYRQIMTECLLAITSNFVIRNKILNLAEVQDWKEIGLWKEISSRL